MASHPHSNTAHPFPLKEMLNCFSILFCNHFGDLPSDKSHCSRSHSLCPPRRRRRNSARWAGRSIKADPSRLAEGRNVDFH